MTWIRAASLEELKEKPRVLNAPPRQIALFRVNDHIYAIDNRCPHEGYPLAVGTIDDSCVLTCNWHNWKFRLDDGTCILGGDSVRSYPTRSSDGYAWVDVSDPPAAETRARILRGLRNAFDDRDFGRICREIARLHYHGLDPRGVIREALRWYYDRLEFGTTHAVPAAADWLALADRFPVDFEAELIAIAESVDHFAFDSLRQRRYAYSKPGEPFSRSVFLEAIESQNATRAEAMAARALKEGLRWRDMEEVLAAAALAHYNDFGHSLIYVAKSEELLHSLGNGADPYMILPLVRHLSYTTREDLIPEFKGYAQALSQLEEPADATRAASSSDLPVPFPATTSDALAWLSRNIASSDALRVYDALLNALCRNMLHFDASYGAATDRPVSQNIGWLDFTHGITFSNAARVVCGKYPQLWRPALLQMACFLGRNVPYIDRTVHVEEWIVEDEARFFHDVHQKLLDHGQRDPIFSAHLLKTTMAVESEMRLASSDCRKVLLAALNRFLNSPIKAKHTRRLARQAIALVSRDF